MPEQTDRSTRNLRHPIFKGHLVVILEADKGGQVNGCNGLHHEFDSVYGIKHELTIGLCIHSVLHTTQQVMKFAWRIGANALIYLGMYAAADTYENLLTYSAPWYEQLLDIQENGVMVRRRRGDTMMLPEAEASEGEQETEEFEIEDLRSWLPAIYAGRVGDVRLEEQEDMVVGDHLEQEMEAAGAGGSSGGEVETEATDQLQQPQEEREPPTAGRMVAKAAGAGGSSGTQVETEARDQLQEPEEERELPADEYETVLMPVKLVHANDMAHCYSVIGLSGASGSFPSPYTLVPKAHLAEHATNSLPHNWEELDCTCWPDRTGPDLLASSAACSRDTRNQGDPAKNARHHHGSKKPPMIPFPKGQKNLRSSFATFLLHVDLGLFREERIESVHPRINLMKRVLACIRRPEEQLFKSVQMLEHKDRSRHLGQVKPKGPRSPQEKAKRAANAVARKLALEQG